MSHKLVLLTHTDARSSRTKTRKGAGGTGLFEQTGLHETIADTGFNEAWKEFSYAVWFIKTTFV